MGRLSPSCFWACSQLLAEHLNPVRELISDAYTGYYSTREYQRSVEPPMFLECLDNGTVVQWVCTIQGADM